MEFRIGDYARGNGGRGVGTIYWGISMEVYIHTTKITNDFTCYILSKCIFTVLFLLTDCCRSQALNLSIRPSYLHGSSSKHPSKPKADSHRAKDSHNSHKAKVSPKKTKKLSDRKVCIAKCQKLCKPICEFDCCLPTHKFADPAPKPRPAPRPAPRPPPPPARVHHVRPAATPQRVPSPSRTPVATTAAPCAGQDPCTDPSQASLSPYGYADPNAYAPMTQGIRRRRG